MKKNTFLSFFGMLLTSLSLLADSPTLLPKLYKSLWPDFCKEHILSYWRGCSEMYVNEELFYDYTDYDDIIDDDDEDDDDYNDFRTFFPLPCSISLESANASNYESFFPYLPELSKQCGYIFCKKCNQSVLKSIGSLHKDEDYVVYSMPDDVIMNYDCACHYWHRSMDKGYNYLVSQKDIDASVEDCKWVCCKNAAIPTPYFNQFTSKYSNFLKQHLEYVKSNSECSCYWPYLSLLACEISDCIYDEMYTLFQNSSLANLVDKRADWIFYDQLSLDDYPKIVDELRLRSLQSHFIFSFFYSNYHKVIVDLCSYVDSNALRPVEELNRLYSILDSIRPAFLGLYSSCLEKHPHPKIFYERGLVYFHEGDLFASLDDMKSFIHISDSTDKELLLTSNFFLQEGTSYAELGHYDKAIASLTKAIAKDPHNKNAYFERASAYFENGDFEHALEDYLASEITINPISVHNSIDLTFARAVTVGIGQGILAATKEFAPSLLASINGLSHGLWAFIFDPDRLAKDLIDGCSELIGFLSDHSALETLTTMAPEAKDFSNLDEEKQMEVLGYMIGKYGMEIFAPIKMMKLYTKLRHANKALTLECMAESAENFSLIKDRALSWKKKHLKTVQCYKKAEKAVSPFKKKIFPETKVRKILHHAGFETFPRPKGPPTNCLTAISERGGGMVYIKAGTKKSECVLVRVMPGKPHSPNPWQRKPYVVQRRGDKAISKTGKLVPYQSEAAHIPINEFTFQGW